ncbi:MAG: hypothetical protein Q8N98_03235 [bacterium]|nr:hypothetical protein [bacterium]
MIPELECLYEGIAGLFAGHGNPRLLRQMSTHPLTEFLREESPEETKKIAAVFAKWTGLAEELTLSGERAFVVKRGNHRHETTYINAEYLDREEAGVGVVIVTRQARACLGATESVLSSSCHPPLFKDLMDQRLLNVEYTYAIPPPLNAEPVGIAFFSEKVIRFFQNRVHHPEWYQPYDSIHDYQTEFVPATEPITDPRQIELLGELADFLSAKQP